MLLLFSEARKGQFAVSCIVSAFVELGGFGLPSVGPPLIIWTLNGASVFEGSHQNVAALVAHSKRVGTLFVPCIPFFALGLLITFFLLAACPWDGDVNFRKF